MSFGRKTIKLWRTTMKFWTYGYGSIPINTIFSGMNIHLPAILGFTRCQGFDTLPYIPELLLYRLSGPSLGQDVARPGAGAVAVSLGCMAVTNSFWDMRSWIYIYTYIIIYVYVYVYVYKMCIMYAMYIEYPSIFINIHQCPSRFFNIHQLLNHLWLWSYMIRFYIYHESFDTPWNI